MIKTVQTKSFQLYSTVFLVFAISVFLIIGFASANFFAFQSITASSSAGGGVSWANWDETSESGLSTDQDGDGSEDTFICFFENTNAGGNETGIGVLSGADLVLTQSGNVAGAVGSPPTRTLDGGDDLFSVTQNFLDTLISNAQNTWTIIIKINAPTSGDKHWFHFRDTVPDERLYCYTSGANVLVPSAEEDGSSEGQSTVDVQTTVGDVWMAMWADGSNTIRGGFISTKPSTWSDFNANKRASLATLKGEFAGESWDNVRNFFANQSGAGNIAGSAYYVIVSQKGNLIGAL